MWVFGCARKIGSNGKSFPLTVKYALWPCKTISVCILPSNQFRPKKTEERETTRKKDRTPAPASSRHLKHHEDHTPAPTRRTPAPVRSHTTMSSDPHPSYPKKHNPIPISANPHPPCPIHTHPISCRLKHHQDRTAAPTRSHLWPTHARSLSFSIYLSLSLTYRSLSLPTSLRLIEFLNCGNVLFWFLFGFVLIFVCFKFIYWKFLL